jgi:beta-glucosidase
VTGARAALAAVAIAAAPVAAQEETPGPCNEPTLRSSLGPPRATPWTDASLAPDARAELLLAEMTLEEKVDLATGERCLSYGYYNAAIERLGIPALTMTDGPAGIRIPYQRVNGGRATLLPAPLALAAAWEPALASAHGDVLGAEAFATGHNVLLGPTLDLARSPLAGRTFEGFGEDPLLAARLAVPLVRAIQAHPVLADAKHFAMYAQETNRWTVDARVDERTLRELYLRPFEAAVRDAGVATVMCGFNLVNGVHSCESRELLTGILKEELGFDGFVLSDWGSIHGTVRPALAGLDQELAFERHFGRRLVDAVRNGAVPAAIVDDKARRILRTMFRFGLFDRPAAVAPLPEREHGARSREIAEQGVVLLKNAGLLPLAGGAVRSIAVVGADAANGSTQGAGAARVEPTYAVSVVDGLRARAAGVRVEHVEGGDPITAAHLLAGPLPVPSSVLAPPGGAGRGLRAEYWLDTSFDGPPDVDRVDRQVALSLGFFNYPSVGASSLPRLPSSFSLTPFAARWTGTLVAPATGDYGLTLTSRGTGQVFLDGALVIAPTGREELASRSATVHLVAGESRALRVEYVADSSEIGREVDVGGEVVLGWEPPAGAVAPAVREAAGLAAAADVAVVVVRDYGTEERDRTDLALPGGQDALVHAVAAANPRTVVVLMTGQPVAMPWLEEVAAVVQAWYPGQEQGNVVARVLFGDVNPSGKLPVTFPRDLSQLPAPVPSGDVADYSEGLLVGYRWYDAKGLEPLFPFGHGLSYTTFRYDALDASDPAAVSFTVTNAGAVAGAEVAQVYVGPCTGDASRPPRQLAGFAKVALAPGASARIVVPLAPEALATWDERVRAWETSACLRPVHVGSSSRDLRLSTEAVATAQAPPPPPASSGGGLGGGCSSASGGGAPSLAAVLLAAALAALRRRVASRG